jgi:hypothetical protein
MNDSRDRNVSRTQDYSRISVDESDITYPPEMLPESNGDADVIVIGPNGTFLVPKTEAIH